MDESIVQVTRAALYARVSTEEQKEGQTIDSQVAELDRFSRDRGWEITGIYKDEGWSGSMLARPELDRLRDDARKGLFNVAIINDVDRLARDVTHLGIVKRDLERRGVKVVFRKLPTEQSPTHNLMVNILGSFAEFERELILDRTRRGRRHKVEVRKQFIGTLAPYGYRYVPKDKSANKDGYLELVPEEATIVRQVFDWVDKQGFSARDVVRRLSEMNVPPRKNGNQWGKSSVLRILKNETYAGVWHFNKYEGCEPKNSTKDPKYRKSLKGSTRLRPRSDWVPLELPQDLRLIDREQWIRVQKQIARNITFSNRNSKHEYLLRGLVRCGGCGARYVGDPCHGKFYYRCHARCKKVPTIKEDKLDDAVWSTIEEAIRNPEIIMKQIEKLHRRRIAGKVRVRSEASEIQSALAELKSEETRVLEVYRKGIITPEQLNAELSQLNVRSSTLKERQSAVLQDSGDEPEDQKRSVFDWCRLVAARLNELTRQQQQRILRLLVTEIVFERNAVRIRCVIPKLNVKPENHDQLPEETSNVASSRIAITSSHSRSHNPVAASRIEDTASHYHARNSVSDSRIEDMASNTPGHNPVADSWIAAMESYLHERSPSEVPFELSQELPLQLTFYERIDLVWIRERVRENPLVTLSVLSQMIQEKFGVVPSVSHVLRIQRLAGVSRIPGSRAKQVIEQPASSGVP